MSNQRDKDREAYIRFALNHADGSNLPTDLGQRVLAYQTATHTRITREKGRVAPFKPETDAQQRAYVSAQYGDAMPRGIGVAQGEYATLAADEVKDDTRFIATDYLIDCHALVLVARDGEGKALRTLLTHVDAMTNIPSEVKRMVGRMPESSRIEATVLGSPYEFNHFIELDLMDALMDDKRVSRIRYHFDAATTVAVDTTTGRILTAKPRENHETSKRIEPSELPLDITFQQHGHSVGMTYRDVLSKARKAGRATSALELEETYRAGEGFITETSLVRFILDRAGGGLSPQETQEITDLLSNTLQQPVKIEAAEVDTTFGPRFVVRSMGNAEIGDFYLPPRAVAQQPDDDKTPSGNGGGR